MKKLPLGLVIEGNSTSSVFLRLHAITAELGPIKSSSLQVARRVSNFLKAGYAARTYSELEHARLILIRVPFASIDRVVAELCDADLKWNEMSFALAETWTATQKLSPLRERGATVASIAAFPGARGKLFVIEGDLSAVRQLRRLLDRAGVRFIEARQGTKHLVFAAFVFSSIIPAPILPLTQQALRESGISGNQLSAMLHDMTEEMLSSFLKGGRSGSAIALLEAAEDGETEHLERLKITHPDLAQSLSELLAWSRVASRRPRGIPINF
jgi:hypothetical protein